MHAELRIYDNKKHKERSRSKERSNDEKTEKSGGSSSKGQSWGWRRLVRLWKKTPTPTPGVKKQLGVIKSSRESFLESDSDRCPLNYTWNTFTYSELKTATNNFSRENLIGKGGYSEVYKGCLENEESVAIKRLNKGVAEEDVFNFLSEIGIIAHLHHPNTARMVGYGVEGGAFLVLQLSSLGSLGAILHSNVYFIIINNHFLLFLFLFLFLASIYIYIIYMYICIKTQTQNWSGVRGIRSCLV